MEKGKRRRGAGKGGREGRGVGGGGIRGRGVGGGGVGGLFEQKWSSRSIDLYNPKP